MLSDSKIRQAGFIRNNSSRKIIYQAQRQEQNSSSDSFSSFQIQKNIRASIESCSRPVNQRAKQHSFEKQSKTLTPKIPKPLKKIQHQPSFQNQKLKNNFFQENPKIKIQRQSNEIKRSFPRTSTPQFLSFEQNSIEKQLKNVQQICKNIENIKMQGNFSFNPKILKLKAKVIQQDQMYEDIIKQRRGQMHKNQQSQTIRQFTKQPKQNNYFNQGQRFEYDMDSSSQDQDEEQSDSIEEMNNAGFRFYQEQIRPKIEQEVIKSQSKTNLAGTISKNQKPQKQVLRQKTNPRQNIQNISSKSVQNQEEDGEQLITEYNKKDFVPKISPNIQKSKRQLVENHSYGNRGQPQPEGVFQTNGGVCFDVDIKQFSQNPSTVDYNSTKKPKQAKKKNPIDEKQELLRRRQQAKIYSKQARFRIFGFS